MISAEVDAVTAMITALEVIGKTIHASVAIRIFQDRKTMGNQPRRIVFELGF